jgi:hydrogenase maturation protease
VDVTALIEAIGAARDVYLFDAMHSGVPAGTVRRVDALKEELPTDLGLCSTHGLGLAEACKLAHILGKLPEKLAVICVEAESFTLGRELSVPVRAAVERVVCDVTREIGCHRDS